ncbi:MAG TPA: type II secretion system F family protein [Methylomirabilota bacterium]|jgi:general secretion pathway protein F|nr:type II secretion system F family protein [Methylomirabilota bacterium]
MPQFHYQATTPQGKIVEGVMEAGEERTVVARLHDQGYLPLRIGLPSQGRPKASLAQFSLPEISFRGKVRQRDLLVMTQELATLISSGLPLDRALSVLNGLTTKEELQKAVSQILRAVQQGKSLAEALADYPKIFPPLYVNMVKAGEVGGFLDAALQRLAEYMERSQQVQEEIKSALTYPVLLTFTGGASLLILLTYVLPKFSTIFGDLGQALPTSTRILLGISAGLRSYWWLLLLISVGLWLGVRQYLATSQGRFLWDRWRLRAWVFGPLLLKREVARFARTLGTLLKSGVPLLQALEVVQDVVANAMVSRALKEVRVGVREGQGIAGPLGRSGVFPPLALQMVSVGEETGRLDEMLMRVAEYYERDTFTQVKRLTSLLEPALILVMGLAVGFVVISMLSAVFSINNISL